MSLDHVALHRLVLRATVAGLLAGCAAVAIVALVPTLPGYSVLVATAAAALGAAFTPPGASRRTRVAAIGAGMLGGLLAAWHAGSHPTFALGLPGLALGLPLGWGMRRGAVAASLAAGAGAFGLALAATVAIHDGLFVRWMPEWASVPVAGSLLGFLAAFGALPRTLSTVRDAVAEALEREGRGLSVALQELCKLSVETHARTREAVAAADPATPALAGRLGRASEDLALKVVALASGAAEVDRSNDPEGILRLEARLSDLDKKLKQVKDEVASAGYGRAREAVLTQIEHHRRLDVDRERLTARLHEHLATLEELHFASLHLRSSDAQRKACEIRPLLDQATALTSEADAITEVAGELMAL
jgi:hypothetical protein